MKKKSARRWREANPLSLVFNSSALSYVNSTGACAACSKLYQAVVGSRLASALSFSHVDVGDAFQFINHISAVCIPPALCLFQTST